MFALENTSLVTISFFADQVTAPLSVIILASVAAGIGVTLLAMLPRFIRDGLDAYAEQKKRQTETVTYEKGTTENVVA